MLFPDVSVCLAAMRPDASSPAGRVSDWLEVQLNGHEQVGLSQVVLSGVVRISTHHRIFCSPSTPSDQHRQTWQCGPGSVLPSSVTV
ncbi:MAG: hypothetical protein ABI873_19470 [Marmoricola sp.]